MAITTMTPQLTSQTARRLKMLKESGNFYSEACFSIINFKNELKEIIEKGKYEESIVNLILDLIQEIEEIENAKN